MAAEESEETFFGQLLVLAVLAFGYLLAGICQILCSQLALHIHQTLHQRLVLLEELVVALGHRTRDDKRRTGIVDQHRVHLIDNGEVVLALHKILGILSHIVAQIVETEFVVGTEGDVCQICLTALGAVGAVLVDAIYAQPVEHVDGTHPLRVTLGQIVVHGHHVYAVACEGIQEDGQSGGKCLTLTREHLCYLALMKHRTSEELHVEVHHIPFDVIATCLPVVEIDGLVAVYLHKVVAGSQLAVEVGSGNHHLFVVRKAVGSTLDNGKHLGTGLVKSLLEGIENLLLQFVYLLEDGRTVLNGCALDAVLQLLDLLAQGIGRSLDASPDLLHTGSELIVGELLHGRVSLDDHIHQGLVSLQVA